MVNLENPGEAASRLTDLTLYWTNVYAFARKDANMMVINKLNFLTSLEKLPFEALTAQNIKTMEYLRKEISTINGLIAVTDDVIQAHLEATSSVAQMLLSYWTENEFMKKQLGYGSGIVVPPLKN